MSEYENLTQWFRDAGSALVAFSGGVDSTLLAKAAFDALAERSVAVTAVSASLAPREFDEARELAAQIGIAHRLETSSETTLPHYLANDGNRCYHCKTELYTICERVAGELARIEVPASEIERLTDTSLRERLLEGVKAAGFRFVTIDLAGYSRGSSNPIAMADGN